MARQDYPLLIELAKRKLRESDRSAAKKIAHYIVTNYPEGLEGWLILGGLSKPKEAFFYLQKAEEIAPDDNRVRRALAWVESPLSQPPTKISDQQTTKMITQTIPQQPVMEKRGLVWLWALIIIFILSLLFLGMGILPRYPKSVSSHFSMLQSTNMIKPSLSMTPDYGLINNSETNETSNTNDSTPTPSMTFTPTHTPTPTSTPTIIPDLYGCDMEIRFTSGPLDGVGTTFKMIDRSYFHDKGDTFDTGKNTGLFYEEQHYLILHSGYLGGNFSRPLEIEFLRKQLELWGNNDTTYIKDQIQTLIGSEMVWICDAQETINLRLAEVVRLSHEASNDLWLNPTDILQIIDERAGDSAQWIGEIKDANQKSVYLGFCGWGPPEITQDRSTYYRYVIRFEVID